MDYLKITITLSPDKEEYRDMLMAGLADEGFESFVENEDTLEAYIPAPDFKKESLNIDFSDLFKIDWTEEFIPDQNWNEEWEKNYFKPLIIADRCVVRAPFHEDYPECEYEIVIEPNMAFGTGNHETTYMMMEHILETDQKNKNVLDMGCGTGILSILSSMNGALSVTSIDIDKWSYDATTENAQINKCLNIKSILGDASSIPDDEFDIIYANIQKNIIIRDMPEYKKVLKPEGLIFFSGFYNDDLEDIEKAANDLGLSFINKKLSNNWCSAKFKRMRK